MEWTERIQELSTDYGLQDTDVARIIFTEYGKVVSDDTVRYHARRKHKKKNMTESMVEAGLERILVINDLHVPFHREQEVIDIINKHRHEITMIVFAGDILDCQGISKFPKSYHVPIDEEFILGSQLLKRIDRLTPNVKKVLIDGNHEDRFPAYLARQGGALISLVNDNILETILNGFTTYDSRHRIKKKVSPLSSNFTHVKRWWYQHNDTIFAHPIDFSNVPARTVCNAVEKFLKDGFIFNTVIIGHTHKYGDVEHFGKWGIENNCLCLRHDYALKGKLKMSPQSYGYTIITQVNGVTDRNQSKVYKIFPKEGDEVWQEIEVD